MLKRWCVAGFAAAALVALTACGSSSSGTPSSSGSSSSPSSSSSTTAIIKTRHTTIGTVLTNASGRTIYWFAKDTKKKSRCNGSCATYWPPVLGTPKPAAGVSLPGTLGTIKRKNGQLQATYDGHPLYLYAGDTKAGAVTGNDINASGALWWAMTPSGTKLMPSAGAPTPSPTSSGYSY
jgi:predicted lipoprotein with Yx(FWY)xxD motif